MITRGSADRSSSSWIGDVAPVPPPFPAALASSSPRGGVSRMHMPLIPSLSPLLSPASLLSPSRPRVSSHAAAVSFSAESSPPSLDPRILLFGSSPRPMPPKPPGLPLPSLPTELKKSLSLPPPSMTQQRPSSLSSPSNLSPLFMLPRPHIQRQTASKRKLVPPPPPASPPQTAQITIPPFAIRSSTTALSSDNSRKPVTRVADQNLQTSAYLTAPPIMVFFSMLIGSPYHCRVCFLLGFPVHLAALFFPSFPCNNVGEDVCCVFFRSIDDIRVVSDKWCVFLIS